MKKSKSQLKVRGSTLHLMKFLMAGVFLLMAFSGCKKSESGGADSGDYYFKATVGGKKINYHSVNFQGGGNDNRWEHIVVGGVESSPPTDGSPSPPSLDFEIWRLGGNIGPGTYTNPAEPNMIARYATQTENGTMIYNTSWGDDVFTINIEAISQEGIRGTFSGTVRNQAGTAVSITDGSFNLPYKDLVNP